LPGAPGGESVGRVKPITALAVLLVLAVSACGGDSAEEKAQAGVCDARAGISKQVESLQDLTLTTATTNQIRDSLTAIGDDLTKIKNVQADLGDERRDQVQDANQAFETEVRGIVSNLGTSTSLSDAQVKLDDALDQLATAYKATFAKIDCG
jgi:hypothetical protein